MNTNRKLQTEDHYDRVIDIMTAAAARVGNHDIPLQEFLPALVDFTAAVGLAVGGEEGLQAFIARMQDRIKDWRAGTFPAKDFGEKTCAPRARVR